MSRKMRAGRTKTELFEITRGLVLSKEYSIDRVIAEFNKRRPTLDGDELRDIIDVGLKVLAGRVRAARSSLSTQYELLKQHGLPEFFELSLMGNGGRERRLVQSLDLTVQEYDSQINAPKNKKGVSGGDQIKRNIDAMREKRFTGTLSQFLGAA